MLCIIFFLPIFWCNSIQSPVVLWFSSVVPKYIWNHPKDSISLCNRFQKKYFSTLLEFLNQIASRLTVLSQVINVLCYSIWFSCYFFFELAWLDGISALPNYIIDVQRIRRQTVKQIGVFIGSTIIVNERKKERQNRSLESFFLSLVQFTKFRFKIFGRLKQ